MLKQSEPIKAERPCFLDLLKGTEDPWKSDDAIANDDTVMAGEVVGDDDE